MPKTNATKGTDAQTTNEEQAGVTGSLEGDTVYTADGVGGADHLPAGHTMNNGGVVSGGPGGAA